ncbi:MAG: type I DNA topoisomerase [Bacteroidaceae bacterium]|nr:type I DNA topoisomerase [Bacteroidaceae bacterium]
MQKNLVIVESPAKAKTIEKFLGKDFKVMSSYGHIRDLKKKEFSIDIETFNPIYEIPSDKKDLVKSLRESAKEAETVWLASDEDREGEAISWHLSEVLKLPQESTKRIVFHEITKPAILEAIENPRTIDLNLVKAQQARRVMDRIVGFKVSPILWKKVKPSLSAGRVQSVAVRLIVEREREINSFVTEAAFRVSALFALEDGTELRAELNHKFNTQKEAESFLKEAQIADFIIGDVSTKPIRKSPAPPFTTSTMQQEAARKLNLTVQQTMLIAQHLYEHGLITYMRTDSVNLSKLCLAQSAQVIEESMGKNYVHVRQFATQTKGAQEAHEAIRPTDMSVSEIEGSVQERRLYDLIWKRTLASQMAEAQLERTTVTINMDNNKENLFQAYGAQIKFDGFLKVYREDTDEENAEQDDERLLPPLIVGQEVTPKEIIATERFTQHPPRYTEASLVKKMEELGIGRPSTYAPTISTIQQREYVQRGDRPGTERDYTILVLKGNKITKQTKKENVGSDKGKLIPTDTGIVVNDYLMEHFKGIMDFNFTAQVEQEFDEVAEGKVAWDTFVKAFYGRFEPEVNAAANEQTEHKVGERQLGTDPVSGKPVSVKIGRFGPVVQIGSITDEEKPRFAQMKKGQSLETITLEEALQLFALPRTLNEFEGSAVVIGAGKFGPYICHNKKYISLPAPWDPITITYEECVQLILEKRNEEQQRHLKSFDELPGLEILNGRYGPYISYQNKNYRLPKNAAPTELTLEECLKIISNQGPAEKKTTSPKRTTKTKKA